MASQLTAIYDAIAAIAVAVDGTTVTVRNYDEASPVVNETPLRILSPLSDKNEGRGLTPITFGGGLQIGRYITDLCLWAEAEAGSGLEYHMAKLIAYQAAYENAALADRKLGLSNVSVQALDIQIGVWEYPMASNNFYFGVKAEWQITELI